MRSIIIKNFGTISITIFFLSITNLTAAASKNSIKVSFVNGPKNSGREILVDGKRLAIELRPNNQFTFEEVERGFDIERGKFPLTMHLGLNKSIQVPFMKGVEDYFVNKLITKRNKKRKLIDRRLIRVVSSINRLILKDGSTNYVGNISSYNLKSGKGERVRYRLGSDNGDFSAFTFDKLSDPLNLVTFLSLPRDIDLSKRQIRGAGGFNIGQIVELSNFNRDKNFAILKLKKGVVGKVKIKEDEEQGDVIEHVIVSDLDVELTLRQLDNSSRYLVSEITVSHFPLIKGICGMKEVKLKSFDSENSVRGKINGFINIYKNRDRNFECEISTEFNSSEAGEIKTIHFVKDKIALNFQNRELQSVTILE